MHIELSVSAHLSSHKWLQVGRAGRDGTEASCFAFLDDGDFLRLRSLAHADGINVGNVQSFLEAVFAKPALPGKSATKDGSSSHFEQQISKDDSNCTVR